jgi:hypothetical protein
MNVTALNVPFASIKDNKLSIFERVLVPNGMTYMETPTYVGALGLLGFTFVCVCY